ncbi:MAG: acetate kinase [Spirochaetales bacterium]|nr:acetate kinase [Spirochaetales bacterium]
MNILTLNCGSSSVKYQLYNWLTKTILSRGVVERVGQDGSFIQHYVLNQGTEEILFSCPSHKDAIEQISRLILGADQGVLSEVKKIDVVGHRVVHGGEKFAQSVVITPEALQTFRILADLAPLHNPPNITGIEAAQAVLPDIPHCAIMDTAWHQTMPASSYMYALPYEWYEKYGIRRYGFHGSSFLYVAKRAAVLLKKDPMDVNLICLHIGNGSSINAVKKGLSYDTSLGFTPLEGLVMGTRAGDHDPAIGFYIMQKENRSAREMETILNKKSGVLGISGDKTDRRDIIQAAAEGDSRSQLAIDLEGYRLKKYIGAYYASLGQVDAIVFTAGVGERSSIHRAKALEGLEDLGIILDPEKNELSRTSNAETLISADHSRVKVFVIPTDEELVMTEDAYALLQGSYDIHSKFRYSFQDPAYVNAQRAEALEEELQKKPALKGILA